MEEKAEVIDSSKKIMSPCDVEALKKCLEENKGDYAKCQSQIEAFKSSCSLKKPTSSSSSSSSSLDSTLKLGSAAVGDQLPGNSRF